MKSVFTPLTLAPALLAGYLLIPLAMAAEADAALDTVIVTGSRGSDVRTVTSSPAPIDVIDSKQLEQTGESSLRGALQKTLPSFSQRPSGTSNDSVARPYSLRGLNGSNVLVLVNGKRRHNSAVINLDSTAAYGTNPVDLDMIPISAIDHVEILRDGASAQYGSDAIAGVINIILKQRDNGGSVSTQYGQYYKGDGDNLRQTLNQGLALGDNGGFFNYALDAKSVQTATRSREATGNLYFAGDPRNDSADRHVQKNGLPKIKAINLSYNAELPVNDALTLYSFSTFSKRDARGGQNYRRPNSTNIIPEIYPDGTAPFYTLEETDYQAAAGGRGELGEWHWDLSSTFGRDKGQAGADETLNASLGPTSPTRFDTYTNYFDQWTNNLDLTRAFEVGLAKPLQVSWGLEHRHERYKTESDDPLSYINGGYIYPSGPLAGQPGAVGAQGAITLTPEDEGQLSRNSYASYLDLGLNPTDKLWLGMAARFEKYDDSSGNTRSGKLSARYDFTSTFAVRGTLSNGFRAPSLSQSVYAQTSNQYTLVNGVAQFVEAKTVRVDSPLAQALGAEDLSPEKSRNISIGFTWQPLPQASLTLDAYQIEIRDRIALTGFLYGNGVDQVLLDNGYRPGYRVKYFTNAADTTTRGVDLVADYRVDYGRYGRAKYGVGFNYNKTEIDDIKETPASLRAAGNNLELFDRVAQGYLTVANPKTKLILSANWQIERFTINAALTRYDKVIARDANPDYDVTYGAKWLTDLEVAYALTDNFDIAVGANNLFDVRADNNGYPAGDINGFPKFGSISPFDPYGGFWYTRIAYNF
ncbi:TPA: TonB-dependent receptor [Pseudomonas putida]|uniref:TonB-dependent receptor plug n=1 Tax=Pseudomonas putida (strain GB-1) TaxID=76869 RepID=B0KSM9_PSEPG|nr:MULTISPECIES: TonB-dependent receptor [Pseudomonas]ABY98554.1 TonB-dependent receptor plug [Pseudomonas putida GB-1]APE98884.1 TonB-dependent receptor [Pseudomonas putida]MBP0709711.1 TonB-dependent receptor [Pseudomonas sp. T34]MCE1001658.1 TonB-dependent receptor [Pseudomonas sp. NMI1173_11]MCK2189154.1 TonB-dependent receptor [Pseudomonas sp. MB04B]